VATSSGQRNESTHPLKSERSGQTTEVLWDHYDVPHIFSHDVPGVFYAMGWAQMKNHGDLLLRLYGQARGRAAEFWGSEYLASDQWVATMGIPERAREWLEDQSPLFRSYLDAFAAGVNDFGAANPHQISKDLADILPVNAVDVLAHTQRVVNFAFVVNSTSVADLILKNQQLGSNAWAISPSRSVTGHAMLMTNPHMPWFNYFRCFEAHLNAPGLNAYGIALVGFPVLVMAFNDFLGWSHTVNTYTGWTLYEIELQSGGYRLDDEICAFRSIETILKVRQEDGSLHQESLPIHHTVHGPVIQRDGKTFALRVAGLRQSRALEQWWDMGCAKNMAEFEASLKKMQIPTFTVIYADQEGHIMHFFNGQVPILHEDNIKYGGMIMPGNVSGNIWSQTHEYNELPRVVDPISGWLHNANDPPYTTTFPVALNPDDYPQYMAPRGPMSLRAQRSARTLSAHEKLSIHDIINLKYSTFMELADRVLDGLIQNALEKGSSTARSAAKALAAWDRKADAERRGAVLCAYWAQAMDPNRLFADQWDERYPLSTPRGLADPEAAVAVLDTVAKQVKDIYGDIQVAWGDVFHFRSAASSIPAIGAEGLGVLSEIWFLPVGDGRFAAVGGDCYTAVIEFSVPVRAMVLMIYGNATSQFATRSDEQMKLFSKKQLRRAWLTRKEVLENLASHETVIRSG
jgi:acyl-homoserine-lactone acylase